MKQPIQLILHNTHLIAAIDDKIYEVIPCDKGEYELKLLVGPEDFKRADEEYKRAQKRCPHGHEDWDNCPTCCH